MEKQIQAAAGHASGVFADCELGSGFDEEFFLLNFGTRLLTAFTDREILIDIALETLADFSRGKRIAIMSLDESGKTLKVDGAFHQNQSVRPKVSFPVEGTVSGKWVSQKTVGVAPLALEGEVPLPAKGERFGEPQCLCLPLVGSSLRAVGLATIEIPADRCYDFFEAQQLRVLSTALAVSLENAKLFSRVIHSSPTNLYTLRFYEIRVEEELAKLRRNSGHLSLILFDLDQFKNVNESGPTFTDKMKRKEGDTIEFYLNGHAMNKDLGSSLITNINLVGYTAWKTFVENMKIAGKDIVIRQAD